MTDTTNLGDIFVVGQRRRPGGAFPSGGGGSGGGGQGENPGDEQNEITDPEYVPPPHPCDNPAAALEWNADAAAAAAAKEFARLAALQGETLNNREWGAYLYRQTDGSVRVGPINSGPAFSAGGVGTVSLIQGGNDSEIIGFIHSHSSGNHLPSDGSPQFPGDLQVLDDVVARSGNPSVRMYIVAQNQGPSGFTPYNQINIYNKSNARSSRDTFTNGPEVNPEGQPCE